MPSPPRPLRRRACARSTRCRPSSHAPANAKRAFALTEEARELAAQSDDRQLDAETRHALARCHFYLADFMPALEYLLEAAQMYQDCGDIAGRGDGLRRRRHLPASARARMTTPSRRMLRALESARTQKLETLEINIYNSLGSALIAGNRIDEAARYLRKSASSWRRRRTTATC